MKLESQGFKLHDFVRWRHLQYIYFAGNDIKTLKSKKRKALTQDNNDILKS